MPMKSFYIAISLSATLLLSGCLEGKSSSRVPASAADPVEQEEPLEQTPPTPTPETPEEPPVSEPESPEAPILKPICSKLSFQDVTWPSELSEQDRVAFSLALNISGSFEGNSGWKNITNNFDGMGMSMGLLNQTLGTDSLQPLLIRMRDNNYNKMQSAFTTAHFQSLMDMLETWEDDGRASLASFSVNHDINSSRLDTSWVESEAQMFAAHPSVTWAVKNLYNGDSFKPTWKQDFLKLLSMPEYTSWQVNAAKTLHKRARTYQNRVKMTSLRSYLFLFDIIVQNGGITNDEFEEWDKQAKPTMTEKQKLTKLLDIRIKRVRPQYKNDVRARKTSLIEGTGKVHGSNRTYEKEYCTSLGLSF